jgi:hypothetical protein
VAIAGIVLNQALELPYRQHVTDAQSMTAILTMVG